MKSFKILVLGYENTVTEFVHSVDEIKEVRLGHRQRPIRNFGSIFISDQIRLYFLAWLGGFHLGYLIQILSARPPKVAPSGRYEEFSFQKDAGVILIIDSTDQHMEWRYKDLFQNIQWLMQRDKFPFIVAFSKQDLPNARTPQQMREILAIPADIKVLGYDLKELSSTKKVALELLELMPQDEIMQQVIEGLKAKI
jgi:hypothetical protein